MRKTILILMSETGGGHRSAAIALKEAFEDFAPGRWQVLFVDVFADLLPYPFNRAGELYRPWIAYARRLWKLLWFLSMPEAVREPVSFAHRLVIKPRFEELLRREDPVAVISVHQFSNHAHLDALRSLGWDGVFATVITDLVSVHPFWLNPKVDLCAVPTQAAFEAALRRGIPPEKVKLSGFPVRRQFRPPRDRKALRRELGLEEDLPTVLLVGGGEGMGRLLEVARAVNESGLEVQLLAVAGRNEPLRRRLESIPWRIPCRVYGFVDFMPRLMQASDVILTKAGPNTICEALAVGLRILLFDYVPGQEEGNVKLVVDNGLGDFAPRPEQVAKVLARWLEEPLSPAEVRARARSVVNFDGAANVVAALSELVYNH